MAFIAPVMLIGVIAIGLPVLIHLIGKKRARMVRFAAVDFLLGSDEKVARRLQLRDLLLLILRALVCIALPLALAKPHSSCSARGPQVGSGPQAAVLVVDNSLASGFKAGDESLLGRATVRAQRIIEQLGADSEVALVLTAKGSPPPGDLSGDHLKLLEDISELTPLPRRSDTTTALRRAADLLQTSPRAQRTIFLLTPLVAEGFRVDESPWSAANAPELIVIDLAEDLSLENLAVTSVSVTRDPDAGSRGVRVAAEITNFGDLVAANVPTELRIGDQVIARGSVSVPARGRTEKVFSGTLPVGARMAPVTVEIRGDRLATDNRRHAIGELRDQVRALVVNGDPRSTRHLDELFYVEAALRPGDREDSGITILRITPELLGEAKLESYDVIVLANCAALDKNISARIADWVRRGGGLWITLGDRVDANAYNESMADLLPGTLRSLLDTGFGRGRDEADGNALHLAKLEIDHPVFSAFATDAPDLREARFTKVYLLGPTTKVSRRRVLARYDNGATAMLEASLGEGRLLLYTSSIDRDWNELPIQPGFLPLAQQAVRYLGRKPNDLRRRDGLIGGSRLLVVPADVERIEVGQPNGDRSVMTAERIGEGGRARFDDTELPGFYRVWTARAGSSELEAAVSEDFALNIDTSASDLTRLDVNNLPAGAGGNTASIAATSHDRRVELWHAVAALLLGFLLLESLLAVRS